MIAHALALTRHAVHTNLRTPFTWVGLILVPGVTFAGIVAAALQGEAWEFRTDLLSVGFAFGAIFVIRSGLAEHRTDGLQDFLRSNYVSPIVHVASAVLTLLAIWVLFCAWTFLVALALSGGDAGGAAWNAWVLFLRLGMLLPFVLMVEASAEVRTPLVIPGAAYFALLFAVALMVGALEAAQLFGLEADRAFPWVSTRPLLLRTAAFIVGGFTVVLVATWLRDGGRRGRLRSAMRG